jgi:hypothetical protein
MKHDLTFIKDRLVCTVCGGSKETLTTECRGGLLYPSVLDIIAAGRLDYVGGEWFYAEQEGQPKESLTNFLSGKEDR